MRNRTFLALILAFLLTLGMTVPSLAAESSSMGLDTFEEILYDIETYHISSPDSDTLIRAAIEGLIDSLKDPHTEYLSQAQLEEYEQYLEGNYLGVGIEVQAGEGYPTVVNTFVNSPAWKAGIKPGDLIIKVDDLDASMEPLEKIVLRIRGPEGTKVRLTIRRPGVGDIEVELVRAHLEIPQITGKTLADGIGYIKINTFGSKAADEFRTTLGGLILQGTKKLILDLRDNPGGLIWAMQEIGSNFIDSGQPVISTVDRNGKESAIYTQGQPIGKGMTMVVLVNQHSASAAEALAGALQDYGIAPLIGSRTYGKGTMQDMINLKAGGVLILTVAQFYTPKGRFIDGVGLNPDIQVLTPELGVIAAQRYLQPPDKSSVVFEIGKSEAFVNGSIIPLRQLVLKRGDVIYLPVRFTFEALGHQVYWQPAQNSMKIAGPKSEVVLYTRDGRVTMDGQNIAGVVPLWFQNDIAYISLSNLGIFDIQSKMDGNKISLAQ